MDVLPEVLDAPDSRVIGSSDIDSRRRSHLGAADVRVDIVVRDDRRRFQVEDRLVYYEGGKKPRKNLEVMHEASEEAVRATVCLVVVFERTRLPRVGEGEEESEEACEEGEEGGRGDGSV